MHQRISFVSYISRLGKWELKSSHLKVLQLGKHCLTYWCYHAISERINVQEPVHVWYLELKALEGVEVEIVWVCFFVPAPNLSAELKRKKKEAITFF